MPLSRGACAEQRFQQLGTARAQQARNAQDLAFMQVEGNIMDVVAQVIQVLHDQNFFADGSLLRRETVGQFTADHQADDFIHIRFCGAHRLDERTVAHDGDIIRNAEDFLHLMGNVDDAFPLPAQPVNDLHQDIDFFLIQRGSRLVQRDDIAVVGDCLRDVHHLALGDRQAGKPGAGVDLDLAAQVAAQPRCLLPS